MGSSVGIDLLEIDRLERALARRPRLAARLFTDTELAYAHSRPRPAMHLAARFCAKEAVVKALALEVWNPHDVEVVREPAARRRCGCRGTRRPGRPSWAARCRSRMTHTRAMAGAVAVVGQ